MPRPARAQSHCSTEAHPPSVRGTQVRHSTISVIRSWKYMSMEGSPLALAPPCTQNTSKPPPAEATAWHQSVNSLQPDMPGMSVHMPARLASGSGQYACGVDGSSRSGLIRTCVRSHMPVCTIIVRDSCTPLLLYANRQHAAVDACRMYMRSKTCMPTGP